MFSFSLHAQDTDNQEFWFVAPDASQAHDDRPTFLMITTGDKSANVTISMPANSGFAPQRRNIAAHSYWKYTFSTEAEIALIENAHTSSGTPTNKGILITSDAPVSAYYQIDGSRNHQKEVFTLKGKKALGKDFYMPFQNRYDVSATYSVDAFRQIQIVATENNTTVTINPKGDLAIGTTSSYVPAGSSAVRTLQKGQTLLWRGRYRTTNNLTGSRVTADKPIAVTLFEDCLQGSGSIDPIGDQLVPVGNVGKNYIVVKGYSNGAGNPPVTDNVVVVAVEDGTVVTLNGGDQRTLQKGESSSYNLGAGNTGQQAYYVSATKPVYCMHQSAADTEIGGALLPSLYAISARRITFIKNNSLPISSMFLVFRESAKDGFTLDGASLSVTASSAGFGDWRYAKVNLNTVPGISSAPVCTIANSKGAFALGYFNGSSTGTSLYGYLSAFGTFSFANDTIYHCGDRYQFDAPYALSYQWTLPDGTTSSNATLTATKSGKYKLTVNQDPYVITDETYLKLQNFNHTLSAPNQLLVGKSYRFAIKLNPQNDPDNNFKASYEWNFGAGASVSTSSAREVQVSYSTPGTKTISLKVTNRDAGCNTTITHTLQVLSTPPVMYWKTNTQDRDWNNVNNWARDAAGTQPILAVPSKHTRVYLPGNAAKYPSLKEGNTNWTHYGQPEAKEVVFRYGSELHYQHKLKYEKAYVNYNWGYYGTSPAAGQPPHSWEEARKLRRDSWHILAAPLKGMASGDFSLGGHPFSWQQKFRVSTSGSVTEGNFSVPFATNDVPLSSGNNAIAVKMGSYRNQTGYRQENLEGLKGVVEIPYFENTAVTSYYPAHNYDALSGTSYFYYFDTKTLKLVHSPIGKMVRKEEAYRFIYETAQNAPPASGIYELSLNTQDINATTREVMVGNPLLAGLDAQRFLDANTAKIEGSQGYKLLSDDGLTWEQKMFVSGNTIPAWKAFIVTLKPSVTSLSFPLEGTVARSASLSPDNLRSAPVPDLSAPSLYLRVLKGGVPSGDRAVLQYSGAAEDSDIRKMILPEGHEIPEVFFVSSDGSSSNLVQHYGGGETVAIGIKTSDVSSGLSLSFENVASFASSTGSKVFLVDKHFGIRQDLSQNPVYRFTQAASGLDRQFVDRSRFVLEFNGGDSVAGDSGEGISIVYLSGVLQIKTEADDPVRSVSVYDLHGRTLFSVDRVNLTHYTCPVSLPGDLFVVRAETVSGKVRVKKVIR